MRNEYSSDQARSKLKRLPKLCNPARFISATFAEGGGLDGTASPESVIAIRRRFRGEREVAFISTDESNVEPTQCRQKILKIFSHYRWYKKKNK